MLRSIACLLLLIHGFLLQAEPLYPRLRKASVAGLQTQLEQSRPDSNRVNLLLQLSEHAFLCSDWDFQPDLNKAYHYLNEAKSLSTSLQFANGQLKSLLIEGRLLGVKGDKAGANVLFHRVIQQSRQHHAKLLEADALNYLGKLYGDSQNEQPQKIHYYQQALELYKQTGNVKNEAYMLKNIADVHLWQGKTAQSMSELLQVIKLYQSIYYPKLHYTYDLLGCVNRNLGNQKEALKYGLAAVASARATKDTFDLGLFDWRLGEYYLELNLPDESIAYYKEALLQSRKSRNTDIAFLAAGGICRNLIVQKKPRQALNFCLKFGNEYPPTDDYSRYLAATMLGDCYLAIKQYREAEGHYLRMLALYRNDGSVSTDVYLTLTNFYIKIRQYTKARTFLTKATRLKMEYGDSSLRAAQLHLLSFKVDSAQGNYAAAIDHYQTYKSLDDYILGQTKSQQIASLRIKFDSDKKDQAIRLLQRESKLQKDRIETAQSLRNLSIVGAVMLVLLLGVIYNRYRLKQRSNQRLEAKQVEINQKNQSLQQVLTEKDYLLAEKEELLEEKGWMLKEIHHRVKNNLQIISSMLSVQSDFLQDPNALLALKDSQNRVYTMALIHQKLYQSDNLALVNMPAFTEEIVDHLMDSFAQKVSVRQKLNIADVQLDVTLATPIGLIINEAVTNSLKYGFPIESQLYRQPGTITVELQPLDEQTYRLTLGDDGVGMPVGFDADHSSTLGLTMIRGLSRQISGQLQIHQRPGVHIRLDFSLSKKVNRHL